MQLRPSAPGAPCRPLLPACIGPAFGTAGAQQRSACDAHSLDPLQAALPPRARPDARAGAPAAGRAARSARRAVALRALVQPEPARRRRGRILYRHQPRRGGVPGRALGRQPRCDQGDRTDCGRAGDGALHCLLPVWAQPHKSQPDQHVREPPALSVKRQVLVLRRRCGAARRHSEPVMGGAAAGAGGAPGGLPRAREAGSRAPPGPVEAGGGRPRRAPPTIVLPGLRARVGCQIQTMPAGDRKAMLARTSECPGWVRESVYWSKECASLSSEW